ncbi:hypothetical protein KEM56_006877 [Ascosphaera pollenicola]|nr:hypothetical protein KEM56_006877 [Ascosphaera pollenicola]
MLCAISGEVPQVPVVSRKTGNVFEKRLVEAYINENGKDPITGEPTSLDDLLDIKSAHVVRPRPPTLTSIPSLLSVFQEEWDALALETYALKQQLQQTRQELSTALYQHDAAVRVIARLTRERDEARDALSKVSVGAGAGAGAGGAAAQGQGDAMQVDSAELPAAVIERIENTQAQLSKTRRKRPIPENWATSETISEFKTSFVSDTTRNKGVSISLDASGDLALVGGANTADIYSLSQKTLVPLTVETGSVTDAVWVGDKAVVSTTAGAVKVFAKDATAIANFNVHAGAVTGLAVHATGDIVASVGIDKSFTLYDLASNQVLTRVFNDAVLNCVKFHPDGHLLAAGGADGHIRIFEVKSGSLAATFPTTGPLQALFFSENGTWLASVTKNSTSVSIWDLRKSSEVKVLETGSKIASLCWDYTGQYLLTGGPNGVTVQKYTKASKEWSEPLRAAVPAVGVAWGADAQSILALNAEGQVTVLSAESSSPS